MFRDTPSQYKRHYGKNEGFAVWSLAFSICSFWFGLAGNGVRDMAWVALVMGISGVVFGVLCVTGKRQKRKTLRGLLLLHHLLVLWCRWMPFSGIGCLQILNGRDADQVVTEQVHASSHSESRHVQMLGRSETPLVFET